METLLLERFEVMEPLGSGGFGEVVRAFDTRMEREVAIKRLPRTPRSALRALREARTVALLNHPNIVTVYDFLEDEDAYYLIMEVVSGVPLSGILAGGALSTKEAVAVALQICHALECAHSGGVIHRDIKPENVMLLQDGRVKVLDFGVAHLHGDMTTDTSLVGTLGYIAPEAASSGPVDDRSDLFSVGVLLYEMTTGTNPFSAESPAATLNRLLHSDPPHPDELRKDIPEKLADTIMEALAKDPDERFGRASDLLGRLEKHVGPERPEDLVRWMVERGTPPPPKPTLAEMGREIVSDKISPWIAPTGLGVLVAVLVAALGSTALPAGNPSLWAIALIFGAGAAVRPAYALPILLGALLLVLSFYRWWLLPLAALPAAGYWLVWRTQAGASSLWPFFSPMLANAGLGLAFPLASAVLTARLWAPVSAAAGAMILQTYDLFFSPIMRFSSLPSPRLRGQLETLDFFGYLGTVWHYYLAHPYLLLEPPLWAAAALAAVLAAGRPLRHRALIFCGGLLLLLYGYYFLTMYGAGQPQVFWTILLDWGRAIPAALLFLIIGALIDQLKPDPNPWPKSTRGMESRTESTP